MPAAHASAIVARGEADDDLRGETVAELRVDVVGADDALRELAHA